LLHDKLRVWCRNPCLREPKHHCKRVTLLAELIHEQENVFLGKVWRDMEMLADFSGAMPPSSARARLNAGLIF
jgi:hypothetical protein